ncbi:Formylglycine-generating sulfatase enzyme [Posidoniimonas polymericola]|uniref:Formylglycine-generating sulfatase enzyme n=1 Tax=Posidoniimonas polymericola TaxID=2528002 RepID=A0A5C5YMP2_9BACT|nr:SUMF1/EgtB/PvdO family nonheme iron enzyme [Posidoniimonas polymericola]TWT76077.1 Formylglycine-generating sulfatase enzyme [Posidoniimonas polymericola]
MADRSTQRVCLLTLILVGLLFVDLLPGASPAHADWFGSGEHRFEIPFVTIGAPGNPADTTGAPNPAGRVDYVYQICKYEVPEEAVRSANALSELAGEPLGLTLDDRGPQKPATSLSWFEAARFVNWLNADQGHPPAYKFDEQGAFQLWSPDDAGYNPANPFRNRAAVYVLPSVDEWYKAAYYDPIAQVWWDYPTGSDEPPIPVASGTDPGTAVWNQVTGPADVQLAGGASPFRTIGQGGNVIEWEETAADLVNDRGGELLGLRGGDSGPTIGAIDLSSSFRNTFPPTGNPVNVGFRVVRVPEPTASLFLLVFALLAVPRRGCNFE